MVAVIGILFVATLVSEISPLPTKFIATTNLVCTLQYDLLLPVSRDVGATGGQGIAGRYQTDPWSHRGRNRDQYGLDPFDHLYDIAGGWIGYFRKRSIGGSVCTSGRLGQHHRLYLLPFGFVYVFLGKYLEPA